MRKSAPSSLRTPRCSGTPSPAIHTPISWRLRNALRHLSAPVIMRKSYREPGYATSLNTAVMKETQRKTHWPAYVLLDASRSSLYQPMDGTSLYHPSDGTPRSQPSHGTARNQPSHGTARNHPSDGTPRNQPDERNIATFHKHTNIVKIK